MVTDNIRTNDLFTVKFHPTVYVRKGKNGVIVNDLDTKLS